jgi:hypothetical protein
MLRRIALGLMAASLALSMSATIAAAGQPNTSCDVFTVEPHGFTVDGFLLVADANYANPDSTGGLHSGNGQVVSQYDVACYQLTPH